MGVTLDGILPEPVDHLRDIDDLYKLWSESRIRLYRRWVWFGIIMSAAGVGTALITAVPWIGVLEAGTGGWIALAGWRELRKTVSEEIARQLTQ